MHTPKLAAVASAIALLLFGCGAHPANAPTALPDLSNPGQTTTSTSPASADHPAPVVVANRNDPAVRAKVGKLHDAFMNDWGFIADTFGGADQAREQLLDDDIDQACGPVMSVADRNTAMAMASTMFGQQLIQHHRDAVGLMAAVDRFNDSIRKAVGCTPS